MQGQEDSCKLGGRSDKMRQTGSHQQEMSGQRERETGKETERQRQRRAIEPVSLTRQRLVESFFTFPTHRPSMSGQKLESDLDKKSSFRKSDRPGLHHLGLGELYIWTNLLPAHFQFCKPDVACDTVDPASRGVCK